MDKTKIVGGVVILIIIAGLIWFFARGSSEQQVSELDAVDTATNFYQDWLRAAKSPQDAEPNLDTLAKWPILSKSLRDKIKEGRKDSDMDPVLCQTTVPEDISMRRIYTGEEEVQMLVTSKDKEVTNQATVTIKKYNEGWYIDNIECSLGEFAPDREFSFEKEGFLLKDSIPAPYNSNNWHLVFEDNGQAGNVAPLLFGPESQCTNLDGEKSVCDPSQFTEATKVYVRSQMTERGANVVQLEFAK